MYALLQKLNAALKYLTRFEYRKIASSNMSRLEAQKGIFGPYEL